MTSRHGGGGPAAEMPSSDARNAVLAVVQDIANAAAANGAIDMSVSTWPSRDPRDAKHGVVFMRTHMAEVSLASLMKLRKLVAKCLAASDPAFYVRRVTVSAPPAAASDDEMDADAGSSDAASDAGRPAVFSVTLTLAREPFAGTSAYRRTHTGAADDGTFPAAKRARYGDDGSGDADDDASLS